MLILVIGNAYNLPRRFTWRGSKVGVRARAGVLRRTAPASAELVAGRCFLSRSLVHRRIACRLNWQTLHKVVKAVLE